MWGWIALGLLAADSALRDAEKEREKRVAAFLGAWREKERAEWIRQATLTARVRRLEQRLSDRRISDHALSEIWPSWKDLDGVGQRTAEQERWGEITADSYSAGSSETPSKARGFAIRGLLAVGLVAALTAGVGVYLRWSSGSWFWETRRVLSESASGTAAIAPTTDRKWVSDRPAAVTQPTLTSEIDTPSLMRETETISQEPPDSERTPMTMPHFIESWIASLNLGTEESLALVYAERVRYDGVTRGVQSLAAKEISVRRLLPSARYSLVSAETVDETADEVTVDVIVVLEGDPGTSRRFQRRLTISRGDEGWSIIREAAPPDSSNN